MIGGMLCVMLSVLPPVIVHPTQPRERLQWAPKDLLRSGPLRCYPTGAIPRPKEIET